MKTLTQKIPFLTVVIGNFSAKKANEQENTEPIRREITDFNMDGAFLNTIVSENVSVFNNTIMNILSRFIPHEAIVCDDKDSPQFDIPTKSLIQEKKDTFKKYRKRNNNIQIFQRLRFLQKELNSFMSVSKQNCYLRMPAKPTKLQIKVQVSLIIVENISK